MEARINRDYYYMMLAIIAAGRSTCTRAKVGAVIVDWNTGRVVSTGYNGSPHGAPHCIDVGCLMHEGHCIRTLHAELNAILHLEKRYNRLKLYSTHEPCIQCHKVAVAANIKMVYYLFPYEDKARERVEKDFHSSPQSQIGKVNMDLTPELNVCLQTVGIVV